MYKTYSSKSAAVAAVRKAGFHLLPVEYKTVSMNKVRPVLTVELMEDLEYITGKGFYARLAKRTA